MKDAAPHRMHIELGRYAHESVLNRHARQSASTRPVRYASTGATRFTVAQRATRAGLTVLALLSLSALYAAQIHATFH